MFLYRLHDGEGNDLGQLQHPAPNVEPGETVTTADGRPWRVVRYGPAPQDHSLHSAENRHENPDDCPKTQRDDGENQMEDVGDRLPFGDCRLEVAPRLDPPPRSATLLKLPIEDCLAIVSGLLQVSSGRFR